MTILRIVSIECIVPSPAFDEESSSQIKNILDSTTKLVDKMPTGLREHIAQLKTFSSIVSETIKFIEAIAKLGSGPDQLYLSLSTNEREAMIWPVGSPSLDFSEGTKHAINITVPFDKVVGVYLWERDTGSDDDFLGSLVVNDIEIQNFGTNNKSKLMGAYVGNPDEPSLYFVTYTLENIGSSSSENIGSSSSALQVDLTDLLSVTAFSGVPGGSALFAIKGDRKVWSQYYDPRVENPAWSGWFELGGSVSPETTNVSAVSSLPGATSLFVVGLDGRIWSKFYDPRIADAKWSDWFALGDNTFPPTSVVTAISGVPGGVTLFVIGHDRKVWSQYYDPRVENPAWSGWFELGGSVSPETTNVSAVSSLPGAASLFVVGLDGRIWSKFYDPRIADAKWSDWFPLGDNTFPPTSVVTAISGVPGGVTLFVIGNDRKVWSQYYDPRVENPAWSGWFELGGGVSTETTNVSAVSSLPGAASLFVVGLDGRIWSKYFDPRIADAKWSDWFPLGDNTFPPTSVVTAISGVPGGVTLFVVGHDRKVWSQYYDPRVENPAWSGWFPL